jgi:hypothetical protein
MSAATEESWEDDLPVWQRDSSPPMAGDIPYDLPAFGAEDAALIEDVVRDRRGLFAVAVPALPYPLWLRGGTADAATCRAVFLAGDADTRIPYQPRRILELGAGAGYRSVALAQRYPDAQILTTEADPAFARLARLNTLPYPNISFSAVAVSKEAGPYAFAGQFMTDGRPGLMPQPGGPIGAIPLHEFLAQHGWDIFDTVVITPDAASMHLLQEGWPPFVRMIAVRTPERFLWPGALAAFDDEIYARRYEGECPTLFRRDAGGNFSRPWPLHLFDPNGLPGGFSRAHVPDLPAYYFPIHPYGFRLHPKPSNQSPPEISVVRVCSGQAQLAVGHPNAAPIRFTISVHALPDGAELARIESVVAGGEEREAATDLPPYFGPCRITFSTTMAETGASTNYGWADFLDASFI